MATALTPDNVKGETEFNNSITNALLAKKVFEDEQSAIRFAEMKGFNAKNSSTEGLMKFYVDEVFNKLNQSELVDSLRQVLPRKEYLQAASNSLKVAKSTPPELNQISKAIGTSGNRNDYELAQKMSNKKGQGESLLFGKTGAFVATHMVGLGLATMTGGMSVALTANPLVSYAIYNAVKSTAFAVLEETGILGAIRKAFSSFLEKVSKKLGFDKFFEAHPNLSKLAKLTAMGVATATAIAATSSVANAAEMGIGGTEKVMGNLISPSGVSELVTDPTEAANSFSNLMGIEQTDLAETLAAATSSDLDLGELATGSTPDPKANSEFMSNLFADIENDETLSSVTPQEPVNDTTQSLIVDNELDVGTPTVGSTPDPKANSEFMSNLFADIENDETLSSVTPQEPVNDTTQSLMAGSDLDIGSPDIEVSPEPKANSEVMSNLFADIENDESLSSVIPQETANEATPSLIIGDEPTIEESINNSSTNTQGAENASTPDGIPTKIDAEAILSKEVGEVELKVEHSIWRTFEEHLDSKGIEFESEAEKNKAMVHLLQEVGRLNPEITDIDNVMAGQDVKFPDVSDLNSAQQLAESITVTSENNILAKGSYHQSLMDNQPIEPSIRQENGLGADIESATKKEPFRDFAKASPLAGGAVTWGTIDAEQYEELTQGADFHFMGFGEDTYDEKLGRIAENIVDNKAGETLSPTERAYAIEQVEVMLESKNSIANMSSETFNIPSNLNMQHIEVMSQDMDDTFVGNYIMENAKTSTEARFHFDRTGHIDVPNGTTIEDVAGTLTREMARDKGLESSEVGKLYSEIVNSIKESNGVDLGVNNATVEDMNLPDDLRKSALNGRYLKQGSGFGGMKP